MAKIINPKMVNILRRHAERTGLDEEALFIVQGSSHVRADTEQEWERAYVHVRHAYKGPCEHPGPYGAILQCSDFDDGKRPEPGFYWIDVDGSIVDKTEELGKPDPAIDGWAGIWRL